MMPGHNECKAIEVIVCKVIASTTVQTSKYLGDFRCVLQLAHGRCAQNLCESTHENIIQISCMVSVKVADLATQGASPLAAEISS